VIAESPDATRAAVACAWCAQPLDVPPRPSGRMRCDACGATTLSPLADDAPRPAPREPSPLHAAHAKRLCSLGEAARRQARRRLAVRVARVAPPGPVLDVGSGDGLLLDALRATGRLVTGIARPATRAGVQDAEITELGGRYAAIVFWQSLGRLSQPATALEHAAALLKPGGLLAIAQPSATRQQARGVLGERWLARDAPRQRVQIPAQTLLDRLHALDLRIERVDHLLDADRLLAGQAVGAWFQGLLGGIVSIEARR
jgi:SAM-dependent methyltransferase